MVQRWLTCVTVVLTRVATTRSSEMNLLEDCTTTWMDAEYEAGQRQAVAVHLAIYGSVLLASRAEGEGGSVLFSTEWLFSTECASKMTRDLPSSRCL